MSETLSPLETPMGRISRALVKDTPRAEEMSPEEIEQITLHQTFMEMVDLELQPDRLPDMEEMIEKILIYLTEGLLGLAPEKGLKKFNSTKKTEEFRQKVKTKFEKTYERRLGLIRQAVQEISPRITSRKKIQERFDEIIELAKEQNIPTDENDKNFGRLILDLKISLTQEFLANNFWQILENKLDQTDLAEFKKILGKIDFIEMVKSATSFLETAIKTEHDPFSNEENETLSAISILIYKEIQKRFGVALKELVSCSDHTVPPWPDGTPMEENYSEERSLEKYVIIDKILATKITDIKTAIEALDKLMPEEQTGELLKIFFQEMVQSLRRNQERIFQAWNTPRPKYDWQRFLGLQYLQRPSFFPYYNRDKILFWAEKNRDLPEISPLVYHED